MFTNREKVLYVDGKDQHLEEENVLAIHPEKIGWIESLKKESFDKAIVQNVPTSYLKSIFLFHLARCLKVKGILEINVDQAIRVLQSIDAAEIDTNLKLAGFSDIQQIENEKWEIVDGKDIKVSSIKLTMVRPERLKENNENSTNEGLNKTKK